jgi:hypothetical protein
MKSLQDEKSKLDSFWANESAPSGLTFFFEVKRTVSLVVLNHVATCIRILDMYNSCGNLRLTKGRDPHRCSECKDGQAEVVVEAATGPAKLRYILGNNRLRLQGFELDLRMGLNRCFVRRI